MTTTEVVRIARLFRHHRRETACLTLAGFLLALTAFFGCADAPVSPVRGADGQRDTTTAVLTGEGAWAALVEAGATPAQPAVDEIDEVADTLSVTSWPRSAGLYGVEWRIKFTDGPAGPLLRYEIHRKCGVPYSQNTFVGRLETERLKFDTEADYAAGRWRRRYATRVDGGAFPEGGGDPVGRRPEVNEYWLTTTSTRNLQTDHVTSTTEKISVRGDRVRTSSEWRLRDADWRSSPATGATVREPAGTLLTQTTTRRVGWDADQAAAAVWNGYSEATNGPEFVHAPQIVGHRDFRTTDAVSRYPVETTRHLSGGDSHSDGNPSDVIQSDGLVEWRYLTASTATAAGPAAVNSYTTDGWYSHTLTTIHRFRGLSDGSVTETTETETDGWNRINGVPQ